MMHTTRPAGTTASSARPIAPERPPLLARDGRRLAGVAAVLTLLGGGATFIGGAAVGLAVFAASNLVMLGAVVWLTARRLNRVDLARRVDVQARAQAEERARSAQDSARLLGLSLEEAAERFRVVVESAPNGLLMVGEDGTIVMVNREVERTFGYAREELVGAPVEILLPEGRRAAHPAQRRAFASAPAARPMGVGRDLQGRRKDGSVFPIEVGLAPIRTDTGTFVLATVVDISVRSSMESARRAAENELRTSRGQLVAALEAGHMGTWVLDGRAQRIVWDDATLALWGRTPEELGDGHLETVLSFIHPEDRTRVHGEVEVAGRDREDWGTEFRIVRSDGATRWIALRGRIERDGGARGFRMVGVSMDVTDRKRAEEAQLRSQKLEALGTLAGGIAHDVNNVLTAIMGNLGFVMEALRPGDPMQKYLKNIELGSTRAAELARRILMFARRREPVREVAPLGPVVDEAVHLLRATLPAMVEIRANVPADLPSVSIDATQIHQVLMNLGTNAAHAMRDRGGLLEIRAETLRLEASLTADLAPGNYVRLSVSDTGSGMDRATLARIFDPFFTTKPPGEGTGLGLSMVHGIMQSHGGAVTVYSEPGVGTIFSLYFPLHPMPAVATPAPAAQAVLPRSHLSVLLVDDEEDIVILGTRALERLGYSVTGVIDPGIALKRFRAEPEEFNAVVTDMAMPGMSGVALVRAIREIRPDTPVILCSGFLTDDAEASARELGVQVFIEKPYTGAALARALAAARGDQRSGP